MGAKKYFLFTESSLVVKIKKTQLIIMTTYNDPHMTVKMTGEVSSSLFSKYDNDNDGWRHQKKCCRHNDLAIIVNYAAP